MLTYFKVDDLNGAGCLYSAAVGGRGGDGGEALGVTGHKAIGINGIGNYSTSHSAKVRVSVENPMPIFTTFFPWFSYGRA